MKLFSYTIIFLFLISCTLEEPQVGIMTSDVIIINIDSTAILADGNSRSKITATLGAKADADLDITFMTDQGHFAGTVSNMMIVVKAGGKSAETFLISDLNVNNAVTVTAKVGAYSTSKTLGFERSYPTDISSVPDKFILKANKTDEITFNVDIFRNTSGFASENTKILISQNALDTNNARLILPEFVFTTGGKASFKAVSTDTIIGKVNVISVVEGASNVTSHATIELVK